MLDILPELTCSPQHYAVRIIPISQGNSDAERLRDLPAVAHLIGWDLNSGLSDARVHILATDHAACCYKATGRIGVKLFCIL